MLFHDHSTHFSWKWVHGILVMALLRMFRFLIDNSSSSHVDNCKNNFLVLSEGPSYGNDRSFGTLEEKFNINFSNASKKFCLT